MHATLWDVLVDYVWAVISWWYALIPGIALSILDVVERWRRGEAAIPSRWITGVFVVGVMVAQFLAYKDVVQRTEGVWGSVDQVLSGTSSKSGDVGIFINLSIRNTGNPSIVEDFHLHIKTPSIAFERTVMTYTLPEGFMDGSNQAGTRVAFRDEDMLINKITKPVETGGMISGWLFFPLFGEKEIRDVRMPDTQWEIMFKDVYGHNLVARPSPSHLGPSLVSRLVFPGTQWGGPLR